MTRARARSAFAASTSRRGRSVDLYCLAGGGIRLGYRRGRVAVATTGNRHYTLRGLRAGARSRTLGRSTRIRIGSNVWYLVANGAHSRGLVEVRRGVVTEVGIVERRLTRTRGAAKQLLLLPG